MRKSFPSLVKSEVHLKLINNFFDWSRFFNQYSLRKYIKKIREINISPLERVTKSNSSLITHNSFHSYVLSFLSKNVSQKAPLHLGGVARSDGVVWNDSVSKHVTRSLQLRILSLLFSIDELRSTSWTPKPIDILWIKKKQKNLGWFSFSMALTIKFLSAAA